MDTTSLNRFLRGIWPTIYRGINSIIYFIINFIKSTLSSMWDSLRGGY